MISAVPIPTCRCCGSAAVRSCGHKHGTFSGRDFEYLACDDCGYLFVVPFFGYQVYNDDYYQGRGPDPFVDYAREYADYHQTDRRFEFEDIARIARGYLAANPPMADAIDWLDFGCGAGGLLKYLKDVGTLGAAGRTWTLRPAGHDVGSYADRLKADGFRILNFKEVFALPDAQFDVISLVEVLEHIERPDEIVALAARLLRPGGLLILTTGNNDCPAARRDGLSYRYHIPEIHVGIFNPRCLVKMYARHGLVPQKVRYSGVVKFKVLKSLLSPFRRWLVRLALGFPPFVRLIDRAYGVSAMPCAVKRRP